MRLVLLSFLLFTSVFSWETEFLKKVRSGSRQPWMLEQIRSDLALVSPADLRPEAIQFVMDQDDANDGITFLARFQIKNKQLSSKIHPKKAQDPRYRIYKEAIQDILKITALPDVDFIIALGDAIDEANLAAPVMAFAKNGPLREKVILVPDFDVIDNCQKTIEQVGKAIKKYPWEKKTLKAIWRGAATGGVFNEDNFFSFPRSQLTLLSEQYPRLIDAKLILPIKQSDDPVRVAAVYENYFGKSMKMAEHLKFKYQILVDGNSCAYTRAYWQMFSNCVIFKHESPNIQWYYNALIPGVHYVACKSDFSDLPAKVSWAKANDKEAEKISLNARKFAAQNLMPEDVYYYLYLVLVEYAKVQKSA